MERSRLRIGIVGTGNIGTVHLKTLAEMQEEAVVTAVADINAPLAGEKAEEFGVAKCYSNAEELIEDEEVDVVFVAVPNDCHAPIAIRALQAGKHVVLEKPMGIDLAAAQDIVKAYRASGKRLLVPHQMRWDSMNLKVKETVDEGALGSIYYAKAAWFRRKGIPGWGTWFTRRSESGGGPLIDIGVHMLDLALHMMGNPRPVSVYGTTFAEFGPLKRGIGSWGAPDWEGYYDVEDLASAFIRMDNGSVLVLEVSWAAHTDLSNGTTIQLMGSDGGITVQGKQARLLKEEDDNTVNIELEAPQDNEGRVRMLRHFFQCIREDEEPISNPVTGFINNLVLDAIYESSRTGREVRLEEKWEALFGGDAG